VTTHVIDASAVIDLLLGNARGSLVREATRGAELIAPAHLDAEVLSALARLHRADVLTPRRVGECLHWLRIAPIERAPVVELLAGAWRRRNNLHQADALYVELADAAAAPLITCDRGMARQSKGSILIADARA
jgi:predicted nucleic acid-binding protein